MLIDVIKDDFCVVGNSPILKGKGRGKLIDSHSKIIRFNDFSLSPKYHQDYGSKVNIWIRGTNDELVYTMEDKKKIFKSLDLIVLRAKDDRNKKFRKYLKSEKIEYFIFPLEYELELTDLLKTCPSTGLLSLFYIYKNLGPLNSGQIYGFSFCKENRNKSKGGGQIHYYNENNLINPRTKKIELIKETFLKSKHNWKIEEKFFKEVILKNEN